MTKIKDATLGRLIAELKEIEFHLGSQAPVSVHAYSNVDVRMWTDTKSVSLVGFNHGETQKESDKEKEEVQVSEQTQQVQGKEDGITPGQKEVPKN